MQRYPVEIAVRGPLDERSSGVRPLSPLRRVRALVGAAFLSLALGCGDSGEPSDNGEGGTTASGGSAGTPAMGGTSGATQGGGTSGGAGSGTGGASGTGTGGQGAGGGETGGAAGSGMTGGSGGNGMTGGSGGAPQGGMGGAAGAGMGGAAVGGAGSGDAYVSDVMVTVHDEIRTILEVTWTQTMAAENVFLEFTFEDGNLMTSRPKPGATGAKRDVVLGVPGSTPVTIRIVNRQGGVDYKTRDYMGTTGAVPSGMPVGQVLDYDATIASPDRWMFGAVENSTGGCTNTSCYYHTVFWLYIMDREGRIVWYYSDIASNATSSFQRIARDGEYIWIEKRPFTGNASRSVLKRTLDGEYSENIPISGLADCIDVTTDGSLLYDASSILRERTRAGQTRDIWSCREHFPNGSCYTNTINWNETGNTVVMSYPERRTVIEISRANGTIVGQYGADSGSYAFDPSDWEFGYQHFPNITKDGTLIVSSHMPGYRDTRMPVAGQHAFEEFEIDRMSETLRLIWHYNDGPEWAMFKGMAIKLPNDNVLANYGTGGTIREITQDKRTAFRVKFDAPPGSAGDDFHNKMVGHNVLIDDLYALNGGGPR